MATKSNSPTKKSGKAQKAEISEQSDAPIVINGQYIKDLSFEAPGTPGIFAKMQETPPEVVINIDLKSKDLADKQHEVALIIKVTCKSGDTIAFVAELTYAGVFTINMPAEQMQAVILIECPRLLFPFARSIIADVSRDGGFPPLMIAPIDFVHMFQQQKERAEAAKQKQTSET